MADFRLLRQCPHHGFSELHQLDTFYNSLNTNDQDALDSAAGGNFLDKMPRDGLAIIESKSKNLEIKSALFSEEGEVKFNPNIRIEQKLEMNSVLFSKECEVKLNPNNPIDVEMLQA
ncbi:hypothetical protein Tco_0827829 [Tanacetum coccineum]